MTLVNETGQPVFYSISSGNQADCGSLDVDGLIDLPQYDNQQNVYVGFNTVGTQQPFTIVCEETGADQQVEMALVVDLGGEDSADNSAN